LTLNLQRFRSAIFKCDRLPWNIIIPAVFPDPLKVVFERNQLGQQAFIFLLEIRIILLELVGICYGICSVLSLKSGNDVINLPALRSHFNEFFLEDVDKEEDELDLVF
jgi:hypothetical protein